MENLDKVRENIEKVIEDNSRLLVGELLSNLEVLNIEGLSFNQIKELYKGLVKDKIYQNSRYLKKLVGMNFELGSIKFRPRKDSTPG